MLTAAAFVVLNMLLIFSSKLLTCVNFSLLQQYSRQLEETMENFAQGHIKILICTNIVESGLDIQNANTIVIQDVQQFGLAQLYQVFLSVRSFF